MDFMGVFSREEPPSPLAPAGDSAALSDMEWPSSARALSGAEEDMEGWRGSNGMLFWERRIS